LRPDVQLTASVKANAYGHGAAEVVRILEASNVDQFMTASLSDALAIRASGSRVRIVMLAACLPDGLARYADEDLIPTIYSWAAAEALSRQSARPTEVYVKVDAGLGRVGVGIENATTFVKSVARLPRLVIGGIYTHLPFANRREEVWARARLRQFDAVLRELRQSGIDVPYRQAVSSSGVLAGLESDEQSAVCVGSLLYGIPPLSTLPERARALAPALSSVRARIIGVFPHAASRTAGSGGTRRYDAGAVTGVIPVGLQDGYCAPSRGKELHVLVGGRRVSVVGVSLAHTVLELAKTPSADVGDEAVLVGHQGREAIPLDALASATNTTVLDVLMRFSGRIPYEYVEGTSRTLADRETSPAGRSAY
jgi:alanine racemase